MKILIVDDDATNRLVLNAFLKKDGHTTIVAENGEKAIEMFEKEAPEMILMDVMMPVMDGYEATKRIKKATEKYIPIIFLTAMTDEKGLSKCVDVGGDDLLTKPYNRVILNAKIDAFARLSQLYNTVIVQKKELEEYNIQQQHEQNVANKVFNSIMRKGCLDIENFHIHLSPVSLFNGDVILAAVRPGGGLNILFGDFTGHGLGAALGALPLSEMFYAMTSKGYSLADISKEINIKLKQQLPMGMFLASCMIEIDPIDGMAKVWNGAIPGAYILKKTGELKRLESNHLPFGILGENEFSSEADIFEISDGDRFILTTDGILEAQNTAGEMYGNQRFEEEIIELSKSKDSATNLLEGMISAIDTYSLDQDFDDDVTLAIVDCDIDYINGLHTEKVETKTVIDSNWDFSFLLHHDLLKKIDPMPLLNQMLTSLMGKRDQYSKINMVFTEMYCNALDHGLLGLDSSTKSSPQGFMDFYEQKTTRLENLDKGSILIKIKNTLDEEGDSIVNVVFEDSGPGFDASQLNKVKTMEDNSGYSGRGYTLIKNYCSDVSYNDKGNRLEASFSFKDENNE